jgi:hypothetical protein
MVWSLFICKNFYYYMYQEEISINSIKQFLLTQLFSYNSYFNRCFLSCGPILWNVLPHNIKISNSLSSVKRKLNTVLILFQHYKIHTSIFGFQYAVSYRDPSYPDQTDPITRCPLQLGERNTCS